MDIFRSFIKNKNAAHRKHRKGAVLLSVLSCVVLVAVCWQLRFIGITMTDEACCGKIDHLHSEACLGEAPLICTKAETPGSSEAVLRCKVPEHAHGEDCFETVTTPGHIHTDACYAAAPYVCGFEEEHTHSFACYSDLTADVESSEDWEATLPVLSGDWTEDLVAVAQSQLGYAESTKHVAWNADGTEQYGYTRYGEWYGNPCAKNWSSLFVSFCLYYTEIPLELAPINSGAETMRAKWENLSRFEAADAYTPQPGDLVFMRTEENDAASYVGIVTACLGDTLTVIEGERDGCVAQNTYRTDEAAICGYGVLPTLADLMQNVTDGPALLNLGDGLIPYNGSDYDFSSDIFELTIESRKDSNHGWTTLYKKGPSGSTGDTAQLTQGDDLRFSLKYTLPPYTLSTEMNTIHYKLPEGIAARTVSNGPVTKGNVEIGKYSIDEEGNVVIQFFNTVDSNVTQSYVTESMAGHEITGTLSFESSVDEIIGSGDGTKIFEFGDVTINIQATPPSETQENISVFKSGTVIDKVQGIASYTVEVTSQLGTTKVPYFYDALEKPLVYVPNSLHVYHCSLTSNHGDNHPSSEEISVTLENGELKFHFPSKFVPGDKYTITYNAEVPGLVNDSVTLKNTAIVINDTDRSDSKYTLKYNSALLEKAGELSVDKNTVTWTITVNKEHYNIGGWELSDVLNGTAFDGTVTIKNITDGSTLTESGHLPFTFPTDASDTYEITYITPYHQDLGSSSSKNTAILTPPGPDDPVTVTETVGTEIGKFEPLTKTAQKLTEVNESSTLGVRIKWAVSIDAAQSAIAAPWSYTDTLQTDLTMTAAQQTALEMAIKAALPEGFSETTDYTLHISATGFSIDFKKPLEKGQKIEFTYESNGPVTNPGQSQTYQNTGAVTSNGHTVTSKPTISYNPLIEKIDSAAKDNTRETEHEYTAINGLLHWTIQLNTPSSTQYPGGISLVENLPNGTNLEQLRIQIAGDNAKTITFDGSGNGQCDIAGLSIKKENQAITITLSDDFLQTNAEKLTQFYVTAKMENEPKQGETLEFANTVVVKDDGNEGREIGSSTQTQKVNLDVTQGALTKTATKRQEHAGDNEPVYGIDYQLDVNPRGADLLVGGDTLTLEDEFSYYDKDQKLIAEISEIKVYEVSPDSSRRLMAPSEYSYQLDYKWASQNDHYYLIMQIPDGKHLQVEYSYTFRGNSGQKEVKNAVVLSGISDTSISDEHTIKVEIQQSSATAEVNGCTIKKVDSINAGILLPQAVFNLERYDTDANDFRPVKSNITTGPDGSTVLEDLTNNVIYKLVETTPPDGYLLDSEPYYFVVKSLDGDWAYTTPTALKGVEIHKLSEGETIYRPNTAKNTKITVEKKWVDETGQPTSAPVNQIHYTLYQKIQGANSGSSNSCGLDLKVRKGGSSSDEVFVYKSPSLEWPAGTKVTFILTADRTPAEASTAEQALAYIIDKTTKGSEYISYEVVGEPSDLGSGKFRWTFKATITPKATVDKSLTEIRIGYSSAQVEGAPAVLTVIPPAAPTFEDRAYGTVRLITAASGWKDIVENLPVTGEETVDSEPVTVTYSYYVVEAYNDLPEGVEFLSCTAGDSGHTITSGTAVITNKVTRQQNDDYELPETGGHGSAGYILGGAALVLLAIGALIGHSRRKRQTNSQPF